jgi:hypothetical protein
MSINDYDTFCYITSTSMSKYNLNDYVNNLTINPINFSSTIYLSTEISSFKTNKELKN